MLSVAAAFVLLAPPASPADPPAEPLPIPSGFRVQASNGYTLGVAAFYNPKLEQGFALVVAEKRGASVSYLTRATVGDGAIEADLGPVGRIDVDWVPLGQPRTEGSPCDDRQYTFDGGRYYGRVDFVGEEGYSEVHTSGGRGEIRTALRLICLDGVRSEGFGGHSPGALLTVRRRGVRGFAFEARKNSRSRPSKFSASISERRRGVFIDRVVRQTAGPGAFGFDVASGFAQVSPPAPFAGSALFSRHRGQVATWRGGLTVDFPGRSGVRLTGPGTVAGLVRAVQNPSHPFRLR